MKIKLLILILLLMAIGVQAQEQTMMFGGFNHNTQSGFIMGGGYQITNNVWQFMYNELGREGEVNIETAYMISVPAATGWETKGLYFGLLAGGGNDWTELSSYVTGATGAVAAYDFSVKTGLWAYGKYKFSFKENDLYEDGVAFGAGFYFRL